MDTVSEDLLRERIAAAEELLRGLSDGTVPVLDEDLYGVDPAVTREWARRFAITHAAEAAYYTMVAGSMQPLPPRFSTRQSYVMQHLLLDGDCATYAPKG